MRVPIRGRSLPAQRLGHMQKLFDSHLGGQAKDMWPFPFKLLVPEQWEKDDVVHLLTPLHVVHCAFVVYIVYDSIQLYISFFHSTRAITDLLTLIYSVRFVSLYFEYSSLVSCALYRSTWAHALAHRHWTQHHQITPLHNCCEQPIQKLKQILNALQVRTSKRKRKWEKTKKWKETKIYGGDRSAQFWSQLGHIRIISHACLCCNGVYIVWALLIRQLQVDGKASHTLTVSLSLSLLRTHSVERHFHMKVILFSEKSASVVDVIDAFCVHAHILNSLCPRHPILSERSFYCALPSFRIAFASIFVVILIVVGQKSINYVVACVIGDHYHSTKWDRNLLSLRNWILHVFILFLPVSSSPLNYILFNQLYVLQMWCTRVVQQSTDYCTRVIYKNDARAVDLLIKWYYRVLFECESIEKLRKIYKSSGDSLRRQYVKCELHWP